MFRDQSLKRAPFFRAGNPPSRSPITKCRKARVRKVNYEDGYVLVEFYDEVKGFLKFLKSKSKQTSQKIPMTQPYVGLGWGIYAGIEEGTECYVDMDREGYLYISAYRLNPYHLNSQTVKAITKEMGFPFSGETPLYDVFKTFAPGDLAFVSKGNSGIIARSTGLVKIFDDLGQETTFDQDMLAVVHRILSFIEYSEVGTLQRGLVFRDKILTSGEIKPVPVSKTIGTTIGILPGDKATIKPPSSTDKGLTEVYSKNVEEADNSIGQSKLLPTDNLYTTREVNVVGDKDISGETAMHGKLLAMGALPATPPVPATIATTGVAMWFKKIFKSLKSTWSFAINRAGRMQLYIKKSTEVDTGAFDVSFQADIGAIVLKLRNALTSQLSLHVEDEAGNLVKFGATGVELKDQFGNHVKGQAAGLEVKGAAKVTVTAPQVIITGGTAKIAGTVAPTGAGALCGIPACLFTGAPQTGPISNGT